jgi:hypothetical protein
MATQTYALTAFDGRPFFDQALRHAVVQGIVSAERLALIDDELAKGIVQIANYFGTAHLRPNLELAARRMACLISLYLEEQSGGDLPFAAALLRDKTLLSLSKGGSEMLKRLHAMPKSTVAGGEPEESQQAFLDLHTAGDAYTLARFQNEVAGRQEVQLQIGFLGWLAKKLGATSKEARDEGDGLLHSAMLVLFVDNAELRFPTPSAFVRLITAAKRARAKLNAKRLDGFLADAPIDYQRLARQSMAVFVADILPLIRLPGTSADGLLHAQSPFYFFTRVDIDDCGKEYTRLVAREWARVTRGEDDNPAVLASIFFFVATGFPAKALMLQREAKEVIRRFRERGFDTAAVIAYVNENAPESMQRDLIRTWDDDLRGEAEGSLADDDPSMPDTHMARALEYLRTTCSVTWKKAIR